MGRLNNGEWVRDADQIEHEEGDFSRVEKPSGTK